MITLILALILGYHFGLGWWTLLVALLAVVMSAEGITR